MENLSSNSTMPAMHAMPEPWRILLITLGMIIIAMGIPGNILTIVAIVKCKPLRTRLNIFIVNLCIADVIAVGYVYPFATFDLILDPNPVPLSWCKLNLLIMNVLTPTGFVTIIFITISRYVKLIHENKFGMIFSLTNTILFCMMTWMPGIIMAVVTAIDLSKISYTQMSRICLAHVEFLFLKTNMVIVVFSLTYASTVLCYLRIWLMLRKHERQLHRSDVSSKMKLHKNRKQTYMSFLIVLLYMCLTMPGFILFSSGLKVSHLWNCIVMLLFFGNSSVNCIVYGAMHKSIRRYYKRLLPSVLFNRVQPTSQVTTPGPHFTTASYVRSA